MAKLQIEKMLVGFDNKHLQGIYHKNGYQYATDGHWMYKVFESYEAEGEGTFFSIAEKTCLPDYHAPNYEKIVERFYAEKYNEADLITVDILENIYKNFSRLHNKTLYNHSVDIKICGETISLNMFTLKAVLMFWRAYPEAKIYTTNNPRAPLFLKDGDNICAFMTLLSCNHGNWVYDCKTENITRYEEYVA